MEILDAGINVISAVNIQHIESLFDAVHNMVGIKVQERIPDSVLQQADEVVNIDLTAEELISRLKAGKIYHPDKVQLALNNFFKPENILQLRELALKEVAFRVGKKVENEVFSPEKGKTTTSKLLVCVSSNEETQRVIIRKAARLAAHYNAELIALYVQTPRESAEKIELSSQRHLMSHLELVLQLGGRIKQETSTSIYKSIVDTCKKEKITTVCMGYPLFTIPKVLLRICKYENFLNEIKALNIDLIIFR